MNGKSIQTTNLIDAIQLPLKIEQWPGNSNPELDTESLRLTYETGQDGFMASKYFLYQNTGIDISGGAPGSVTFLDSDKTQRILGLGVFSSDATGTVDLNAYVHETVTTNQFYFWFEATVTVNWHFPVTPMQQNFVLGPGFQLNFAWDHGGVGDTLNIYCYYAENEKCSQVAL